MKLDVVRLRATMVEAEEAAAAAECAGFDGFWVTEVANDPFLSMAVAARSTRHIELGTAIALAFTRSPMVTALASWELQGASDGRFVLGLGPQVRAHVERRFSSVFDRPGPRLREQVLALRAIFAAFSGSEQLRFQGEFYRLDLLPAFFLPPPLPCPPPPIYVAAFGPYSFRMAGEVADGVHVHPLHSQLFLRELAEPRWAAGLDAGGRSRADLTVSVQAFAIAGQGEERRRLEEEVRTQLAFHCTTPAYRSVLEVHGRPEVAGLARAAMASGDPKELACAVPDDLVEEFVLIGDSWADVGAEARRRYDGLADRVSLYCTPPLGDPQTQELVKAFAAAGA